MQRRGWTFCAFPSQGLPEIALATELPKCKPACSNGQPPAVRPDLASAVSDAGRPWPQPEHACHHFPGPKKKINRSPMARLEQLAGRSPTPTERPSSERNFEIRKMPRNNPGTVARASG